VKEIVRIAKKYDAYIMVDEAHSMGFMGEHGRGLCEAEGLLDQVDFILGTFSKSVGTIGGFCVSNHASLETIRYAARSYLFTASLPPAVVEAARANLKTITEKPEIREKLWDNARRLYSGLKEMGFNIGPDVTPVMGVVFEGVEQTISAWNILLEHGVYVNMALPPATPHGISLLRCSVCAAHTTAQIDFILEGFRKISETHLSDTDAKEVANLR
jgi:7-keto-8-aminopelargonate synthetase-like enzyme